MSKEEIKFGTDGWRGIMAEDFTFPNFSLVVQAIANYLLKNNKNEAPLIIGYDNRFFAERFAERAAEVFVANGLKVLISKEAIPTPATAFMVKHFYASGAVMLTASHNRYEYNGIKFIPEYAGPASKEITNEIEKELELIDSYQQIDIEEAINKGLASYFSAKALYFKQIDGLIDNSSIASAGMKIVVDSLYGAGNGYIDGYLQGKADLICLHNYRDPFFGGDYPDPDEERLQDLIKTVLDNKADLGLALDGDGDRFGVIDSEGVFYTPNQVFFVLLPYLLEYKKWQGPVYRTIATTHAIDKICEFFSLSCVETPVGFKYIAEGFLNDGAIFGCEESGGMSIFGHIPEKDGILAGLLIAEMIAVKGMSLAELQRESEKKFGKLHQKRLDLQIKANDKKRIMSLVESFTGKMFGDFRVEKINAVDGKKFSLSDDAWFLVRPSGTENVIRVYMEASSVSALSSLEIEIMKWLEMQ